MKIKLGQLNNIDICLTEILKKELPITTAFKIADFVQLELDPRLKTFDNERLKICEKHGKKDENNNLIQVFNGEKYEYDIDNKIVFAKEIDILCETEIDINFIPLRKNELGKIEIKPNDIILLRELGLLEK